MDRAVSELAYALYDAENTTRLSEDPDAAPQYFARAEKLLSMIRRYRTKRGCVAIARAIRK